MEKARRTLWNYLQHQANHSLKSSCWEYCRPTIARQLSSSLKKLIHFTRQKYQLAEHKTFLVAQFKWRPRKISTRLTESLQTKVKRNWSRWKKCLFPRLMGHESLVSSRSRWFSLTQAMEAHEGPPLCKVGDQIARSRQISIITMLDMIYRKIRYSKRMEARHQDTQRLGQIKKDWWIVTNLFRIATPRSALTCFHQGSR